MTKYPVLQRMTIPHSLGVGALWVEGDRKNVSAGGWEESCGVLSSALRNFRIRTGASHPELI